MKKNPYNLLKFILVLLLINQPNQAQQPHSTISYLLPHFKDVAQQAGVANPCRSMSATWVDYDEDGFLDLYVANGYHQKNAFYRNTGNGVFKDIIDSIGLAANINSGHSLWIDPDNDGHLDFYLNNWHQKSQFFKNTGQNSFVELPEISRLINEGEICWADFNNDGWLDLFISVCNDDKEQAGSPPNRLYQNLRNGHFRDISIQAGIAVENDSWNANWIDYNNDGLADLYFYRQSNSFYRNNGDGTFTDVHHTSKISEHDGSTFWADFNNDGWIDLFVADSERPALYKNLKDGTFQDITFKSGVPCATNFFLDVNWVDFDNDGYLDLHYEHHVVGIFEVTTCIFRNNGDETFTDVTRMLNFPETNNSLNSVWGDYDNDGDQDLYLPSRTPNLLFRNEGSSNNWIQVSLHATISNRDAIGAKVKVVRGKLKQYRTVGCGHRFKLQTRQNLIFGIGKNTVADSIIIRWPTGVVQETTHVSVNQKIFLCEKQPPLFTDVSAVCGIDEDTAKTISAAFIDYNNDQHLDIWVNQWPFILYQNQGNEKFTRSPSLPMRHVASISKPGNDEVNRSPSPPTRSPIGTTQSPSGATRSPSDTPRSPSGTTRSPSDTPRSPSGTTRSPSDTPRSPSGTTRSPSAPTRSPIGTTRSPSAPTRSPIGTTRSPSGTTRSPSRATRSPSEAEATFPQQRNFKFLNITDQLKVNLNLPAFCAGCGDFDNDGFDDIYLGNEINCRNTLFKNMGDGTFTDVTETAGVAGAPISTYDLALGDYNNDGLLDIFVGNNGADVLYFNKGNLSFVDVTVRAGVSDSLISYCTAADYDNDGDPDIFVANNRGGYDHYTVKQWPNRLYRNNGDGTFTDVAREAGVQDMDNSKGCCFGDYDNDGNLDLYIGNDGSPNRLYRNNGDGAFTDVTEVAGVAEPIGGMGVVFADFDNDGYLDIYAAEGNYIPEQHNLCLSKDHLDKVYLNNRDGTFTDVTARSGVQGKTALTSGITTGDYDNDGDLDVFLANSLHKGKFVSPNVLFKNNGNNNNWLHLKLIGHRSNRSAIGARVQVLAGDLVQIREVEGGHGCGSQNSLAVEFGLGNREAVDQVIIHWPSPHRRIIQRLSHVPINALLIVEEPRQFGPLQISATAFGCLKIGMYVMVILLSAFLSWNYVFIPQYKKYSSLRKRKQAIFLATHHITGIEQPFLTEFHLPEIITVNINLVQFRDEQLLTYSVMSNNPQSTTNRLISKVEGKNPYPIKEIKIQRLQQKIAQMWQSYARYIANPTIGTRSETTPLVLLQDIGEKIYQYFGLTRLLEKLFSLPDMHLHFNVNHPLIPWHWAYQSEIRQYLCEKFSYSISFAGKKNIQPGNADQKMRGAVDHSDKLYAVLFYGDWKGHRKELIHVASEIQELNTILHENKVHVVVVYQDCDRFAETIQQLDRQGKNLRLIHYSGHIENNMLALSENQYFAISYLKQAYGLSLTSRPVVFFNGCRSGKFTDSQQKLENLPTEFLDCGAATCIVTHFQVPELSAKRFASRFYYYFITTGLTVSQALRQARLDMAIPEFAGELNPDDDITRFFYDLYGDGTVVF